MTEMDQRMWQLFLLLLLLALLCSAAAAATVLFAYAISISRQLQSPDACQTQCKPRRRSCHRTNLPPSPPLHCPSAVTHWTLIDDSPQSEYDANANARQRAFILDIKRKRIWNSQHVAAGSGSEPAAEAAAEDGNADGAKVEVEPKPAGYQSLALLLPHKTYL